MNHTKSWSVVSALAACSVLTLSATAVASPFQQPKSTGNTSERPVAKPANAGPCICLASDVIGMDVVSPSGESLGDIDDVVIHPNGEIAYAVLSFGGVMGMGDKLFAMPWSVLQPKPMTAGKDDKREIVLAVEKDQLKKAPGFDKAHWPSFADANWSKDVDAFYASHRRADAPRAIPAAASPSSVIWKASDLKGFNVVTPSGDKLGDIKDIAIDTNGRVAYAVLSVGGFLGVGDRLVAVPWEALKATRDGDKKKITLAATKERLELAPQYSSAKDKRAEMCDPKWVGTVYEFYSVRPYWNASDMDNGMKSGVRSGE